MVWYDESSDSVDWEGFQADDIDTTYCLTCGTHNAGISYLEDFMEDCSALAA